MTVSYSALPAGAEIKFETTDLPSLTAIHRWLVHSCQSTTPTQRPNDKPRFRMSTPMWALEQFALRKSARILSPGGRLARQAQKAKAMTELGITKRIT